MSSDMRSVCDPTTKLQRCNNVQEIHRKASLVSQAYHYHTMLHMNVGQMDMYK